MKTIVTFLTLIFSLSMLAQSEQFRKIDSIIASKVGEDTPGIAVGVVKDGKIMYEKYAGLSNLPHQIKFDEKTRSNIASTAKQFTALMILQLSIENKLKLEDDIRTYLPSLYPNIKEAIKIRHVINHTSGIREYIGLLDIQGKSWWTEVGLRNREVIKLLEKQEDLAFKPGTQYSYSNSGYIILTKIIEKVTGEKFTKYSKKFFEELGMNDTGFPKGYMGVIPHRADPYSDWGSGEWFQSPVVTRVAGDGYLFTTLRDQLKYEIAVQNAKSHNDVLLIRSQQAIPNSEIKTYGYGLRLFNWYWGERTAVHHDGGTNGYNSQTVRFTDDNLTVFVMSNHGNIASDDVANAVANVMLPKLEKKKDLSYDSRFYNKKDFAKASQILGQYISSQGTLIRIEEKDGKTYYKRGGNVMIELIKENDHTYYPYYDQKAKFVFYNNEIIFFKPSKDATVYQRSTELPASAMDLEAFVGQYESSELDMSFELKFTKENEFKINFSNRDKERNVTALNRNELLSRNFIFKVQRDAFDRPTDLLVSLGRATNIRFRKQTNMKFQPKIPTENGSINVTTIGSRNGNSSTILLTKNYANGNEIWYKRFGGKGYDKASSILDTGDGYLIIGSTSSYGVGNYDMYVIKIDKKGKKLWQNTYGKVDNDYGYTAEKVDNGFIIKGTTQLCNSRDVLNRKCSINVWFVNIDNKGNEVSNTILEEIDN